MDATATVTSKGQITLPKSVREALGLGTGDQVHFRVQAGWAVLAKVPNFLELAGSVPVPVSRRGASWERIRSSTRTRRARRVGGQPEAS